MEGAHKPHRAPHAGAKAEKKKAKRNGERADKGKNPRAFIMSGSRRTEKQARRSAEVSSPAPPPKQGTILILCGRWERRGCMSQ